MHLSLADIIGSIGVFILLIAFALNLLHKISRESILYILMNIVGGSLACYASYLISYVPFIILESIWTIVSIAALVQYFKKKDT